MQILGLIPVGVSLIQMPEWVTVTVLNVYTVLVVLFNFYIIKYKGQELIKLDDPKQIRNDGSWILKLILGYD